MPQALLSWQYSFSGSANDKRNKFILQIRYHSIHCSSGRVTAVLPFWQVHGEPLHNGGKPSTAIFLTNVSKRDKGDVISKYTPNPVSDHKNYLVSSLVGGRAGGGEGLRAAARSGLLRTLGT